MPGKSRVTLTGNLCLLSGGQRGWMWLPFILSPQVSVAPHLWVCMCLTPKCSQGSSSLPWVSWATVTSEDVPGHLSLNIFSLHPKHRDKVWWSVLAIQSTPESQLQTSQPPCYLLTPVCPRRSSMTLPRYALLSIVIYLHQPPHIHASSYFYT